MVLSSCVKRLALTLVFTTSLTSPSFSATEIATESQPYSYANLVEPLLPAVVNISTTTLARGRGDSGIPPSDLPFPKGSPLEDFFKEFYDQMQTEGPRNSSAVGSGFV